MMTGLSITTAPFVRGGRAIGALPAVALLLVGSLGRHPGISRRVN